MGLARLASGQVVLVEAAAPGDRLELLEVRSQRGVLRALRFDVVEEGPGRQRPPCPWAARCGGCDWMHLSVPAQLEAKRDLVDDAFRRTARLHGWRPPIISPGPHLGYRQRVRLKVMSGRRFGFQAKGSHDLVEIDDCILAHPAIREALRRLRRERPAELDGVSSLELRVAPGSQRVLAVTEPPRSAARGAPRRPESKHAAQRSVTRGEEASLLTWVHPGAEVTERWPHVNGLSLLVPARSFTQVHWETNRALVNSVLEGVRRRGISTFVELYSGVGNFSLPLLAAGLTGKSVELDAAAVQAARQAARDQGLEDSNMVAADAAAWLSRAAPASELLLIDPPRGGAPELLEAVVAMSPRWILWVACDPVTLARDLRVLHGRGWELVEVSAFDMFPQTHHVETLVWVERQPRGAVSE